MVNPHTFLSTEAANTRRFAWMVPTTRPMDNMALDFQTPQEDELAPCLMSLRSHYLGISFPRREDHYARYNELHDAFFSQKELIPKARYHELGFRELESDPIRAMEKLYARLALEGFESFKPLLQHYADSLTGYRKNAFPALDEATREKIARHWRPPGKAC